MLPVSMIFQRMRRIVRDMSKGLGKEANLILAGETTEVDKTILDALSDPIMHRVRNAMDHAIESPEERVAVGKASCGNIILSAQTNGGDVIISVSDDGKGLDKNMILNKARAGGLLRKPESEYTDKEIFNLLMAPGFSTREEVSEYSGRGVGMDVVKSNIEKIGGAVIIESRKGIGTNIILKIPLTLAIISCIEVAIGNDVYSIPVNNIRESFKSGSGQLITDPSGVEMIILRGQAYPIIRLYDIFSREGAVMDIAEGILVLVEAGDYSACLLADSLIGKFQVVVKPLPPYLNRFHAKRPGISGCTIMGNGNISLIINVQEMLG
jgi:two-component system chemotaxis sensor kinase CheA